MFFFLLFYFFKKYSLWIFFENLHEFFCESIWPWTFYNCKSFCYYFNIVIYYNKTRSSKNWMTTKYYRLCDRGIMWRLSFHVKYPIQSLSTLFFETWFHINHEAHQFSRLCEQKYSVFNWSLPFLLLSTGTVGPRNCMEILFGCSIGTYLPMEPSFQCQIWLNIFHKVDLGWTLMLHWPMDGWLLTESTMSIIAIFCIKHIVYTALELRKVRKTENRRNNLYQERTHQLAIQYQMVLILKTYTYK